MKKLTGYQCFKLYLALKLHFTNDKFDFFKYKGKSTTTFESYRKRNDFLLFETISKRSDKINLTDYFIAMLLNDFTWMGVIAVDQQMSDSYYFEYRKIMESLTYTFQSDLDNCASSFKSFKEIFDTTDYPPLFLDYLNGNITIQTFTLLNYFVRFVDKFDTKLKGDFLWEKAKIKCIKYEPFLIDRITEEQKQKLKNILKEIVVEYTPT